MLVDPFTVAHIAGTIALRMLTAITFSAMPTEDGRRTIMAGVVTVVVVAAPLVVPVACEVVALGALREGSIQEARRAITVLVHEPSRSLCPLFGFVVFWK